MKISHNKTYRNFKRVLIYGFSGLFCFQSLVLSDHSRGFWALPEPLASFGLPTLLLTFFLFSASALCNLVVGVFRLVHSRVRAAQR